jgi:hypothetical protein
MPQFRAPPAGETFDAHGAIEAQKAEDGAKAQWKDDNLLWAFDKHLRDNSPYFFSEAEITDGQFEWLSLIPGTFGVLATVVDLAGRLKRAAIDGTDDNPFTWDLVGQIVAQILFAAAAKKLPASKVKGMVAAALKKLGIDGYISRKAAALIVRIQRIADQRFTKLMSSPEFKKLRATDKGTEWHKAVFAELRKIEQEEFKRAGGFHLAFEEPLALGSGEHHPGPNVDVTIYYEKTRLIRIELKLSLDALRDDKTQTFILTHDSLTSDVLHVVMTPVTMVLLPDFDNGLPLRLSLL